MHLNEQEIDSRFWVTPDENRWVLLKGVLFHHWPLEVFEFLCSDFKKLIRVEVLSSIGNSGSMLRAFVKDCNPNLIKAVVPLIDHGLTYPVGISVKRQHEGEQSIQNRLQVDEGLLVRRPNEEAHAHWVTFRKKMQQQEKGIKFG